MESAGNKFSYGLVKVDRMRNIDRTKMNNCMAKSWESYTVSDHQSNRNTLLEQVLYQTKIDRPYGVPSLFIDGVEYNVSSRQYLTNY